MKISEVIYQLQEIAMDHGDLDVLGYDVDYYPSHLNTIEVRTVRSYDCYPEHYNMPAGFQFVALDITLNA